MKCFSIQLILPFFAQWSTVAILLFSLAIPMLSSGAIRYVDNSGSPACSNHPSNGSAVSPWCTVSYGIEQLSSGDTLYVQSGTYSENIYISGPAGTASAPTVIRAYPGTTVTLRGLGTNSGRVKIANTSYITFHGFIITNYNQGLFIDNSNNITISNCSVHDVGQEGIHPNSNSSYITVDGCTIYNTGMWKYNGEGIYVGGVGADDNTNHVTVRNSVIYNTADEGIELKPGTHHCLIDGNTLHHTNIVSNGYNGAAIEVNESTTADAAWPSNPAHVIRNNIIHDIGTGSGGVLLNSGIRAGTGVIVYNNLIYNINSAGYGILVDNPSDDSYNRLVYHNTIDVTSSRALAVNGGATDVKNNIGPSTPGNLAPLSSFFVNKAGGDYHLVADSTPINAGVVLTNIVPTDIAGVSRSAYGAPDGGAYEYQGTSGGGSGSPGNTIHASNCSQMAVRAAINSAMPGDTVIVPAGSCTWTTTSPGAPSVLLNKAITLQGQTTCTGRSENLTCADSTIIYDGTGVGFLEIPLQISTSGARLTGFTFFDTRPLSDSKAAVQTDTGTTGWRIDHCHFHPTNSNHTRAITAYGYGLIDHNLFQDALNGVDIEGAQSGDTYPGDLSWSQAMQFGTVNAVYIEDNNFVYTMILDGAFDSYAGARLVFRYNNVVGTNIGGHGLDSGGLRSTLWADINNNTFSNPGSAIYTMGNTRGGSFLLWNNIVSNGYNSFWWIQNYRSDSSYTSSWGPCDGTNSRDQNSSGKQGYPCQDQVGRGTNQGSYPQYSWRNTFKGSAPTTAANFYVCGYQDCIRARTYHLLENRDYFNEVTPFNGSAGVGVGSLASRPSTCTAGVAYFATDQGAQGTLYQCAFGNKWNVYYVPYSYPHPLQVQTHQVPTAPAAPTGLTSNVQ
ncbi:MAG: hypothetical protein IANPNBLG_04115 [Bryobacteraceae bacterium]|nr:hypothetical protein [Bryobacteraceae bacterium]